MQVVYYIVLYEELEHPQTLVAVGDLVSILHGYRGVTVFAFGGKQLKIILGYFPPFSGQLRSYWDAALVHE